MYKYFGSVTTSDRDMIRMDIMRELLYKQADELLVMKNAVNMMAIGNLDVKFDIPAATRIAPEQITEGAAAALSTLKFYQVPVSMVKYQTRIRVTDEAKARQIANNQVQMSLVATSRGLAFQMDADIASCLQAGADQTVAANAVWNSTTAASPATDFANAIGKIFDNTNILDTDIQNVRLFTPAKIWAHMMKPIEVGYLRQTFKDWMQSQFGIVIYPSRKLTTAALAVIASPETAMFLTYNGTAVPTAEQERITGVGEEYVLTRYYNTFVVPDKKANVGSASYTDSLGNALTGNKTSRICSITGVSA
jgi:hypothetical protein